MENIIVVKMVPINIPLPIDFIFSFLLNKNNVERNKETTAANFNIESIEIVALRNKNSKYFENLL